MADSTPGNVRNIVLLSHGGAGKTSLAEAALFSEGAISRLGKVDEGNTTSDYDPDEIKRKISINLSLLPGIWRDTKLNIVDTPGYPDFVGEVKAGIRVAESAIIVVSASSGVEVGTRQVWKHTEEAGMPRFIFINKMDRENANFQRAVEGIQETFGSKCLPLVMPIGAHNDFSGVIDLLNMKAYTGADAKEAEVPAALKDEAASWREKLVEAIAETDDTLIEEYLGGEELTIEELTKGLKKAVGDASVVPILAGSAIMPVGVGLLLDAVCAYLPSPLERQEEADGQPVKPDEKAPLAALIFKTTADPYVGKLTYFRVYRGTISSNTSVWNATHEAAERIGQLFLVRGKTQEPVDAVSAGDIGAVAKLAVSSTGETLSSQENPVKLTAIEFPNPVFSESVNPKTKADLDKLGSALTRLSEEDPTLHVKREVDTHETIISGMGATQLEVAAEKMQRKFGVGIDLAVPKVPYKETITNTAKAEHKHKKQTGGHGQYGHVVIEVEPMPRGGGVEFVPKIVGGAIPKNYIPAVEKGVMEAASEGGVMAGTPVVDVRVTLIDGGFHPVDSSEICFKIAGSQALRKGLEAGHPILLEPVMTMKIITPESHTGDVIGDLNTKRAHVHGMNPDNGDSVIDAEAPLAEIQRYAIDLKSLTQGCGWFTSEFSHYQEVPTHIAQKLIEDSKSEEQIQKVV